MTDPQRPERGWLKEVLEDSSRRVAELPGWVFGGVNPFAPDAPPGMKEAALKDFYENVSRIR